VQPANDLTDEPGVGHQYDCLPAMGAGQTPDGPQHAAAKAAICLAARPLEILVRLSQVALPELRKTLLDFGEGHSVELTTRDFA
jgi:hypothetical protein